MELTLTKTESLKSSVLVKLAAVSFWVILTALSAQMKIWLPFTPVPITLQTGVVMLGGVLLGKYGFFSQVLYILLGCIGLPFFAVDLPGVKAIWGPTGGYLFGFLIASYLAYRFVHYPWNELSFAKKWLRLFAMSFVIFLPGVIVLAQVMNLSWSKALQLGLYPFIFGAIIKTTLVSLTPNVLVKNTQKFFG
ncbi:MAG: biotin transporter BioY [Bdellovibrionales bacterium]|nr:biotin transporter BioY [Bdellovibrionales bacterium]